MNRRQLALGLLALLMAAGIGIGIYMSWHHEVELYGGAQTELVGCEEAEGVSCDIVNTSEWSEVMGVPTFTWAAITYAWALGLCVWGWREARVTTVLAVAGIGSVLFSGFLYYVSVVELGYVCLWCMRLYGVNALWLVLSLVAGGFRPPLPDGRVAGIAALGFALSSAVGAGVQGAYRSTLLGADAGEPAVALESKEAVQADKPVAYTDPDGVLEPREIPVKTEDDKESVLHIRATDPWKGNPAAEVVVVEFVDFECGYCKRASGELARLYEAYQDEVLFVFKPFPMDPACNVGVNNKKHRDACNAHIASVCMDDQDRFWAFHDLAFKNQHQLDTDALRTYASAAGADMEAFEACVRDPSVRDRVKAATEDGAALDIHGTPRIFINDSLYRSGSSAEQLARAVERAKGLNAKEAADAASAFKDERPTVAPIPDDVPAMREVHHGDLHFFIDTFEASVDDAGKASSGKHQIPGTRMSWFAAKDACESAGKRLCTEQEWVTACQGAFAVDDDGNGAFADDMVEGTTYPYGEYHEKGRCWDGKDRDDFRPVYTGETPGCVSADGVYEMTGNVEEWVGTSAESAVLLGGGFDTTKDFARCYRRNDTYGAGYANKRTGFRCCKNP